MLCWQGTTTSIWMRNVQLGIFSIMIGSVGMLVNDYDKLVEGGFFQGYDGTTWVLVFVQALTGPFPRYIRTAPSAHYPTGCPARGDLRLLSLRVTPRAARLSL